MKVSNMVSSKGNKVANQFVITDSYGNQTFQSYDSIIAKKSNPAIENRIELDENYWDYSVTTGKYRNMFLGETKKETEKKIKDGVYKLVDLN